MIFKELGNAADPTVLLLHGGGLSWWSLQTVSGQLAQNYHVVAPVIDGHGEDGAETFVSIQDSAAKVIRYIKESCCGQIFALGGLSIGAQIAVEVLAQEPAITQFAILESALVYPIKGAAALAAPTYKLCYGLIRQRWFAKLQAKELCVPMASFERYYRDSIQMSKESLINITLSNGNYPMPSALSQTKAKVLIIVGGKELSVMKKSAERLHAAISGSTLYVADGMKHGELSLAHPEAYLSLMTKFWENMGKERNK